MPDIEGGGASITTEPAAGSSAATDVSLRDHLAALRSADAGLARERTLRLEARIEHVREVADLRRSLDQLAIDKALDSAKELAEKHNDLIRTAEKKDEGYATKVDLGRLEAWQAKIQGGLVVIGVVGIANFIKLWAG